MKYLSFLIISCLLIINPLFGSESSKQIGSSGDISSAIFTGSGLIVEQETSANSIDLGGAPGIILPETDSSQRLIFSDNGENIARLSFSGSGDYFEVSLVEVFRSNGELLYRIEKPGLSEAVLADNGRMIGLKRNINIADRSELSFFDEKGTLIRRVNFPVLNQVKIGDHGGGIGAISGKRGLVIFNLEGEELVQLGQCQWFDLSMEKSKSSSNSYSIACAYTDGNKIGVYSNIGGEIKWEKPFGDEIFRDVKVFSSGNKIEIAGISKHNLYLIDARSGETIWQYKVESPVSLTSCDIFGIDKTQIAWGWEIDEGRSVPQNLRHVRGGFSLAAKESAGKDYAIYNEELNYSLWNVFTPEVEFTHSGLLIQTRNEVRFLQLNMGGNQR